jgi:hypothetical protein
VDELKAKGHSLIKRRHSSARDYPFPGPNGCC